MDFANIVSAKKWNLFRKVLNHPDFQHLAVAKVAYKKARVQCWCIAYIQIAAKLAG